MGEREKVIEKAELVYELKSLGVHSIAAEIAEKVCVFFEHQDLDASTRQQKAEHHPGRAADDDAAFRGNRQIRHLDQLVRQCLPCGRRCEGSIGRSNPTKRRPP